MSHLKSGSPRTDCLDSNNRIKKFKCFIWCRFGARGPFTGTGDFDGDEFGNGFCTGARSRRQLIVISNVDDNGDMEAGVYEVQEEALPLKEIYQCDEDDLTKLCIRDLAAREKKAASVTTPTSTHSSATEAAVTCGALRLGAALR